jgi:hypothetical protein
LGAAISQLSDLSGGKKTASFAGLGLVVVLSIYSAIPKFVDDIPGSYVSVSNIYEDGAELILNEVSSGEMIVFSNRKAALMTNMTMPLRNGIRQTIMAPAIEDQYIVKRAGETQEELISIKTTLYD